MATLNYTGDGGAMPVGPFTGSEHIRPVTLYRRLKTSDIIAADATMTTNGYIAADDIIQVLDVPAGFFLTRCMVRIITACDEATNIEVGLAGGAEGIASFDIDGAAGTCVTTIETDSWACGNLFTSADTIDVEYTTTNCASGELELFVTGYMLTLGSAS